MQQTYMVPHSLAAVNRTIGGTLGNGETGGVPAMLTKKSGSVMFHGNVRIGTQSIRVCSSLALLMVWIGHAAYRQGRAEQ